MSEFFVGCAFLALQHKSFPAKKAMKCFHMVERPAIAFLWGTFGTKHKNINQFFKRVSHKKHLVQVYMTNGVCQRKNNCKRGELFKNWNSSTWNQKLINRNPLLLLRIRSRVKSIRRKLERFGNERSRLVLVPALEDNFTNQAAQVFIEEIRKEWPYEVVRNPVGHNPAQALAGADHLELHHANAPLGGTVLFASNDGEDINFDHRVPTVEPALTPSEVRKYLQRAKGKGCIAVFLWSGLWQGLTGNSGSAPAPRKRNPDVPRRDTEDVNSWLREVQ